MNWGIIPGGLVAWAITEVMNYRDAIYYSVTGDQFSGKEAAAMKFVNRSFPSERLRDETMVLARKLEAKSRTLCGTQKKPSAQFVGCKRTKP